MDWIFLWGLEGHLKIPVILNDQIEAERVC